MTRDDITRQRLHNQHISHPTSSTPAEVVGGLAAVQAQDYAGARWALGLRLQGATDSQVEQAFNTGAIFRTHVLRPTWHFVTPDDIGGLLALTGPRVHAVNAAMYRKLGLDSALFKRVNDALVHVLQGRQHRTRDELRAALGQMGLDTHGEQRMTYLLMQAELDGIICSGPRKGKQFTYMLLAERAPHARTLARDAALVELTRRYFTSRGPATVHDFARWSGLTVADARRGVAEVKDSLDHIVFDGAFYWAPPPAPSTATIRPQAHLLSIYDEYIAGYKDRSAMVDAALAPRLWALGNALTHVTVVDGQVVGAWRRSLKGSSVIIEFNHLRPLTDAEQQAVADAATRYRVFLNQPVILNV